MVNEHIARSGPIPFSQFQELALYHPQAGFYATNGYAGRAGDFITSPEVGPLFAHVLARALERWWRQLGRPDPFFVFEAGAGTGALAMDILEADPACLSAMRYVTIERSAALRSQQSGRLPIVAPEKVLSDVPAVQRAKMPLVACLPEFPEGRFVGVVLANELLDNMPVDLYKRRGKHWYACHVGVGNDGGFSEVIFPLEASPEGDAIQAMLDELAPGAVDGAHVPVQSHATAWLRSALDVLREGRVVCFDYVRTTRWMSRRDWDVWLRTYRNHRPGGSPLDTPGTQDITCDVAIDQLSAVRPPDRDRTQTDFLEAHGLVELVASAREQWHDGASTGDLRAMRARSRVNESRALTDPKGLGRFRVLEWHITDGEEK